MTPTDKQQLEALIPAPKPNKEQPRYAFHTNDKRPGYVSIVDHTLRAVAAEFCYEHAMIISMMYNHMSSHNQFAADEFMYGHILGYTYTLLHADKYPKCEIIRSEDGSSVHIRMTQPDGTTKNVDLANPSADTQAAVGEMLDRSSNKG